MKQAVDTDSTQLSLYYWPRSFLLRARNFRQPFRDKPYQRLAATLIVATDQPFVLQADDLAPVQARAVLLGPKSRRHALHTGSSDTFVVDAGMGHTEYTALTARLGAPRCCRSISPPALGLPTSQFEEEWGRRDDEDERL